MKYTRANNGHIVEIQGATFVFNKVEDMVSVLLEKLDDYNRDAEFYQEQADKWKALAEERGNGDILEYQHSLLFAEAERLMSQGLKIDAVKSLRENLGYTLKEAVDCLKSWDHLKAARDWNQCG